ncbi:MAG: NADPH-dependent curcumin reductase CurA [Planctomycetota bacterium]|jgi:NADPH-dependent curcumin reductase CurA
MTQSDTVNRRIVVAKRPLGELDDTTLRLETGDLTMRGFIVFDDFGHLYPEFQSQMAAWVEAGKVAYREEMITGLERAPAAFVGLLRGEAFGKRVVHLDD